MRLVYKPPINTKQEAMGIDSRATFVAALPLAVAVLFSLKIPTTSIASALQHQQSTRSPEDIIGIQQPTSSFGHGMCLLWTCAQANMNCT